MPKTGRGGRDPRPRRASLFIFLKKKIYKKKVLYHGYPRMHCPQEHAKTFLTMVAMLLVEVFAPSPRSSAAVLCVLCPRIVFSRLLGACNAGMWLRLAGEMRMDFLLVRVLVAVRFTCTRPGTVALPVYNILSSYFVFFFFFLYVMLVQVVLFVLCRLEPY